MKKNKNNNQIKYCYVCNGSGEGQYDGSYCFFCKGKGVLKNDNE